MRYFVYRLIPPRPTFAETMTEAESALMGRHGAYWTDLVEKGTVVVFGPVADPAGTWGFAVIEAADEDEAHGHCAADPAVRAGVGFSFQVLPMPRATLRQQK